MKEINIADTLARKRRERRFTQDEVAAFMGVSKASVSKWETGQSYPDITLLPRLAALFNVSIDELVDYRPQLSKEDIRRLYRQLSEEFSARPFDETLTHCEEIIRKYYSCFPLLLQMGILLVNHSMLATGAEQTQKIVEGAKALFVRVRTESGDAGLSRQAEDLEAVCLLALDRAAEVPKLMDMADALAIPRESLLAAAYGKMGCGEDAKTVCQVGIYRCLMSLLNLLQAYQQQCADDKQAFEETCRRTLALADAFEVDRLHPTALMPFCLFAARLFLAFGDSGAACDYLERYTRLAVNCRHPLRLQGDGYFNLLDGWLENTLTLGRDMPRDETIVRKSMTEALSLNPAFAALAGEPRFQNLVTRLKNNEQAGGSQ